MTTTLDTAGALELLRKHSEWLTENWSISPEGREYKRQFDTAVSILTNSTPALSEAMTDGQIISFAKHAADRIPESNYEGRVLHAIRMSLTHQSSEPKQVPLPDVDDLAQFIRFTNGAHKMGAGALAEHIVDWLATKQGQNT